LAQISISSNKLINAYKYSEAAKTISPENPDTIWISAVLLSAEEKYVEVLELATPVVENWKNIKYQSTAAVDLEKYLLLLGDTLFKMNDLEKSAQLYESALKVNNYSPEACYGLGMCYKEAELFEDAKKMFEWAIKYNPNYENATKELEILSENQG
jgi:tetratricopeptide (TPR) repeat protein